MISAIKFFTGCCEWWTKRSKRVATLEFDRVRKSMSVIARESTGHNRLLVKVYVVYIHINSNHKIIYGSRWLHHLITASEINNIVK